MSIQNNLKKKNRTPHFKQNKLVLVNCLISIWQIIQWKRRVDKIVDNSRCGIPGEWRAEGPKKLMANIGNQAALT